MKYYMRLVSGLLCMFPVLLFAEDRMLMDDTSIVGAKELPKVLYVVPWKDSEITISATRPNEGPSEQSLDALDRDVYKREVDYYSLLNSKGVSRGTAK